MKLLDLFGRRPALVSAVCATFLLAACGGGGGGGGGSDDGGGTGGGGGGNSGGDDGKPTAEIVFPQDGALFNGETVIVRGSATDDGEVTAVKVNGVSATSENNFKTWTAVLPLEMGANELVVVVEDDEANKTADAATATVTRTPVLFYGPTGIAFDAANQRAIVLDGGMTAITAVDAATGERETLSSNGKGSGPLIQSGLHVDVSEDGNFAYLYDYTQQALIEIDLASGTRKVLSSPTVGSGDLPGIAYDLAVDSVNNRTFVANPGYAWEASTIYMIDHATGERVVISSPLVGSGPQPGFVLGLDWDSVNEQLVIGTSDASLVLLKLDGTRTSVSIGVVSTSYDVAVDASTNTAYVTDDYDYSKPRVLSVDLASGATKVLAVPGKDEASEMASPNAVTWDSVNKKVLVADLQGSILAIDPTTLETDVLADNSGFTAGSGPAIGSNSARTIDPANRTAYFVDDEQRLVSIDLQTGTRTAAAAPMEHAVSYMVHDPAGQRLLAISANELIAIDTATGVSTSLATLANIMLYDQIYGMVIDTASNRLFVSSNQADGVIAIPLDTFVDVEFSNYAAGSGDPVRTAGALALDAQRDRLLMGDQAPVEVRSVSLTNGNRETLFTGEDNVTPAVLQVTAMDVSDDSAAIYLLDGRAGNLLKIQPDSLARSAVAGHRCRVLPCLVSDGLLPLTRTQASPGRTRETA